MEKFRLIIDQIKEKENPRFPPAGILSHSPCWTYYIHRYELKIPFPFSPFRFSPIFYRNTGKKVKFIGQKSLAFFPLPAKI